MVVRCCVKRKAQASGHYMQAIANGVANKVSKSTTTKSSVHLKKKEVKET